jgi:hypothetical protein
MMMIKSPLPKEDRNSRQGGHFAMAAESASAPEAGKRGVSKARPYATAGMMADCCINAKRFNN